MTRASEIQSIKVPAGSVRPLCAELLHIIQRAQATTSEHMLRLPQVKSKTGYANSTIWKACKEGYFPPPIYVGVRSVAWKESELQAWIDANTLASRANLSFDMRLFIKILIEQKGIPELPSIVEYVKPLAPDPFKKIIRESSQYRNTSEP